MPEHGERATGWPRARWAWLFGAVVAAGCGGDAMESTASGIPFCEEVLPLVADFVERSAQERPVPADDDRYGGTIVMGANGEIPDGMNSAALADYAANQHHQFVNLMTLVDYDEQGDPRGYLAESWDVSDDGRQLTFHIRQDVFWHDGEQTDAHDVAFTYGLVTNPLTAFPNASWWDHYGDGPQAVEVLDDFTVRLRMEPHSDFLDPFRALGILPEHLLGDVPPDQLKQHPYGTQCPVGNGPFVFVSHQPQDRWVFEANPAFPEGLGGRPFFDRYVYRVIPEQTTLLTELLTENIDVYVQVHPSQVADVIDDGRYELWRYPSRQYVFVAWNARRPQLSDSRVRRALTMGTNRAEFVEAILEGYGSVSNNGVPPFHYAFDPEVSEIAYDPAAASALLDEAGWVDRDGDGVRENSAGEPLSFTVKYNTGNRQRQAVAEIMQSQLGEIGVDAQPQVVEWGTLLQQITSTDREFEGVVMGWVVEYKLDEMDLFHSERIDQPFAWAGTDNTEIDRLLGELSETVDREESLSLWREYQQVLAEEQPYTFFYFPERLDAVHESVRGVHMDSRGDWVNFKDWYRDPDGR